MKTKISQPDKTSLTGLYRLPKVVELTGLPAPTVWRKAREGSFPKPVKVSERITCWIAQEIHGWIEDRISESRSGSGAT